MAGLLGGLLHDAFDRDWEVDEALSAFDELAGRIPRPYTAVRGYLHAARPHAFTFLDERLQRRLARLGGLDWAPGSSSGSCAS
jgi:hypothetical protein